jgi:translation initiation factor IF-3
MAFTPPSSPPGNRPPSVPPGNRPPGAPPGNRPPFTPRPSRFATGYQNQTKEEHRLNERIRVPQVRLIDEKGNQVGVVDTREALQMARDRGLDLMEISPNSNPPVCKIADYGKFKYEKKKKEQEAKKKQVVIKVKEIQLRPQTDDHDREYKLRNVREFLQDGDKAKITMLFRGREVVYSEQGLRIMMELADSVKDLASIEAPPKLEGKKMIMILTPLPKKGGKVVQPPPQTRIIVNPINSANATNATTPTVSTGITPKKSG